MRRIFIFLALMFVNACATTARAGTSPCTDCAHIAAIVDTLPGTLEATVPGKFHENITDHDRTGCMLLISGSWRELGNEPDPAELIRHVLARDGWREGITGSDGPDGTSYVMVKGDSICLVQGRWDGGDDSDPGIVPSDVYQVIVFCSSLLPDDRRRLAEDARHELK